MYIFGIILPIVATFSGLKISEVIAQESGGENQEITVTENLHNGKIIVLSDGSTWEVDPKSLQTSQSWILPSALKIEKINHPNHPNYPYKITNIHTKSSILARPIAKYQTEELDITG